MHLTPAEHLKLEVLATGMVVTERCREQLGAATGSRPLTPADYASTTGWILKLDDDVWVNAPIALHNPNFVTDATPFTLDLGPDGLVLSGGGWSSGAEVWLPPAYHGSNAPWGRPWNDYVFSHGDRVRLAPIGGCAMACKFCNLPYEDPYLTKPVEHLVAAVRTALEDPVQPARHMLISGGTPRPDDVSYLRDVYRTVLQAFPGLEIDIMMAPVEGLLDVAELRDLGLHQLSVNLEIFDAGVARPLMPHKFRQGRDRYLTFIEEAAAIMGPGGVRSMLMVGLEEPEQTLAGVQAIVECGGTPVLSPFRPDPATPLRARTPPDAKMLRDVFLAALDIVRAAGGKLGPSCAPCTHNVVMLLPPDAPATDKWPVAMAAATS